MTLALTWDTWDSCKEVLDVCSGVRLVEPLIFWVIDIVNVDNRNISVNVLIIQWHSPLCFLGFVHRVRGIGNQWGNRGDAVQRRGSCNCII